MNQEKISELRQRDFLLGAIKLKGNITYYLSPIAYWIMDYKSYDPDYNPNEHSDIFRDNLLQVNTDNADLFLRAMQRDLVEIDTIKAFNVNNKEKTIKLQFLIDFDNSVFTSTFFDIDIHEYISKDWEGIFVNQVSLDEQV
jgi:hypothetical protein